MRIHVASSDQALAALGFVEARSGAVNAAEAVLESLAEKARTCYVPRSGLCAINIALRRLDRAAEEWTLARAEGDWELGWAGADPRWDPLRGKVPGI